MAIIPRDPASLKNEYYARVARTDGSRSFQQDPDTVSGILVDENGRVITRAVSGGGFDAPLPNVPPDSQEAPRGSAPEYGNLGLVQEAWIIRSANTVGKTTFGPYVLRLFGYVAASGWVQVVSSDWSGGEVVPTPGAAPSISIAVTANSNFVFGDWPLDPYASPPGALDTAYYIAFSSTGNVYTPGGTNLWFASLCAW